MAVNTNSKIKKKELSLRMEIEHEESRKEAGTIIFLNRPDVIFDLYYF